jgi:hypothetical protein
MLDSTLLILVASGSKMSGTRIKNIPLFRPQCSNKCLGFGSIPKGRFSYLDFYQREKEKEKNIRQYKLVEGAKCLRVPLRTEKIVNK